MGNLADAIGGNFGVPSPGAVNDKLIAFFSKTYTGSGSPEGVVTAATGGIYYDISAGTIYGKQSGSGNTGWLQIGTSPITAYTTVQDEGTPLTQRSTINFVGSGVTATDTGGVTQVQIGTSGAGSPIVRAFPFAFDTAGILTGAALYTPTIGDVLLDAWIEIDTAFDGTNSKLDIGAFLASDNHFGYFAQSGIGIPVIGQPADAANPIGGLLGGQLSLVEANAAAGNGGTIYNSTRTVPGKFTSADPIKVCCTQDGKNNGADPGNTQGAAVLYLVTCTPV